MKRIADVRALSYGCSVDVVDDYVYIGEDKILEAVQRYTSDVIKIFRPEYLRKPNEEDTKRFLGEDVERGWSEMLGSVDCMHWTCMEELSCWIERIIQRPLQRSNNHS
jgi:hypothetical protein